MELKEKLEWLGKLGHNNPKDLKKHNETYRQVISDLKHLDRLRKGEVDHAVQIVSHSLGINVAKAKEAIRQLFDEMSKEAI